MYMCVGVNVHLLLVCSLTTQKALSPAVAAPLGWSARPNTERLHEFFMKADGERTVCVCAFCQHSRDEMWASASDFYIFNYSKLHVLFRCRRKYLKTQEDSG